MSSPGTCLDGFFMLDRLEDRLCSCPNVPPPVLNFSLPDPNPSTTFKPSIAESTTIVTEGPNLWIIPFVFCLCILCILCVLLYKYRVKISVYYYQKKTIIFRGEKKVEVSVRATSIVLEPKSKYEANDYHTVVMASTEKLSAEPPGTPIINAPRGFYKDNYEDIPSSSDENEETEGQNTKKHPPINRENSEAPLVENAASIDKMEVQDKNFTNNNGNINRTTKPIQTISSSIDNSDNKSSSDNVNKPGTQKKRVSRGQRKPTSKLPPVKKPSSHGHFVKKAERAQDIGHANVKISPDNSKL